MIQIEMKNRTEFLGRNGVFYCNGFTFLGMSGPPATVRIYPRTTKDRDGRGFIEVPVEEAKAFIEALRQEANVKEYYLIHAYGCIEPKTIGPFESEDERNGAALDIHDSEDFDSEDDALFWADLDSNGKLTTGSYSGGFFKDEEGGDDGNL